MIGRHRGQSTRQFMNHILENLDFSLRGSLNTLKSPKCGTEYSIQNKNKTRKISRKEFIFADGHYPS